MSFETDGMREQAMKWKVAIVWDLAVIVIVVAIALWELGVEYIRPLATADSIAADIAPTLGVPEARLREELTRTMYKGMKRRLVIEAVPLCFIVMLLAGRLLLDWQALRPAKGRAPDSG
jgi:hypothetical protein